ncbi:Alanine-phosphoribitol ligase, partial [Globisporangium splendens]
MAEEQQTAGDMRARQVVVVTGATSGIGLECCRALVEQVDMHVIVVARSPERVASTVELLMREAAVNQAANCLVEGYVTDLSSLASVRELVNWLITKQLKLFALVCNAAVENPPVATSVDGFETTFATNHLGHFLLTTSLWHSRMFATQDKARIVVLSSSLHDAEGKGSSSKPDVSDWDRVAFGDAGWFPKQAYSTSKLCNLFFGYEFQRKYGDEILVYMYSPGFVPDTGLFRNHSSVGWFIIKSLVKMVAYWRPEMAVSTPERSGAFLARLASDRDLPWDNGSYFSIDHLFHTSEQSKDPALAHELWERSKQYVDR